MRHSPLYTLTLLAGVLSLSCSGGTRAGTSTADPTTPVVTKDPARPAPKPVPPAFRLPGDVAPVRYTLDLTVDPKSDAFSGVVAIELDVKQATSLVWLNATDLTIAQATFTIGDKDVAARVVPGDADFVGFALDPPLAPNVDRGPNPKLTIRYQGLVDKVRSRGIYREHEGDKADDWYVYTFFEPTDARRAFPCFDEPNYKVPWRLTITAPEKLVVAANTSAEGTIVTDAGTQIVTFAETPPLPSYLVAFIVGPFEIVDAGFAGHHKTPFRILVPRGRAAETRYAAASTPALVGHLEDYFGMPYPYGKLDVAVVPRYWGTMEHPGLVALGQPLTLIKPDEETIQRQQFYADIAVHELAHYWFGDYVTCRWWNDTWLNEALGEWMDAKMTDTFEPKWKFQLERLADIQAAMHEDSLATTQKIRLPVESKRGIENAFSASITYMKGNAVMAMFEAYVGEANFQRGIRRYMKEHAWGSATLDDFLAAIDAEAGRPGVPDAMKTFLDQPGVPLVSVALECKAGTTPTLHLTQERYLPVGSKGSADQTWQIPVCAHFGTGAKAKGRACTLLTAKSGDLVLDGAKKCPTWVDANADALGYYRVSYSDALRKQVVAAAGAKQLTVRERMGLVADLGALIDGGQAPTSAGLSLVPALAADPDRHIFYGALQFAGLIRGELLPDALRPNARRFLAKVFGKRAKALGWQAKKGEADDARQLRPTLLALVAIGADDKAMQKQATQLTRAWLADRKAVDPDLVGTVLAIAAHHGDRALFDELLAAAKTAEERNERARLIGTLGAFDDVAIAQVALDLVAAATFDLREANTLVFRLLYGRNTKELTYTWIKAHFDELAAKMRDDEVMWTIGGVVGGFCDQTHRDDAAAFFGERAKQHDGAEKALENALEAVDLCIASWERTGPDIAAFLETY